MTGQPLPNISSSPKRLIGGPFDGAEVPRSTDAILLTGDDVPAGMVARYRFTAGGDAYKFDGYDKVVATIPRPGGPA